MTSTSYYPILEAPGCQGWTTLCNFAPNNWERTGSSEKLVNVTWTSGGEWRTENLGTLAAGAMRSVRLEDVASVVTGERVLPLLSLTQAKLPARSATLPVLDVPGTAVPAWRAALGLSTAFASTSYQGEVDPFPPSGSMLTFCPFVQFGDGIENYLIFLNIERDPAVRAAEVEIYDSLGALRGVASVTSNSATVVPLDGLGLTPHDLPTIVCRKMAGVPLYFSKTADGAFLSLEHTHPPASYAIHGKRWEVQKILKHFWFSKVAR